MNEDIKNIHAIPENPSVADQNNRLINLAIETNERLDRIEAKVDNILGRIG